MRGGMTLALGLASASLLAGCGGGGARSSQTAEIGPGGIPRTSYDHVFFVGAPQTAAPSEEELLISIRRDIGRLATSSWESARENLFRYGRRAVIELIDSLDRTEPTSVPARSLPGIGLQSSTHSWPLGYVAYAVLVDFVNNYTDFRGTSLPPHNRNAWVDWWEKNGRTLTVYDASRTAPEYVQRQLEAERLALTSRFDARPRQTAERGGRRRDAADAAPTRVKTPEGEQPDEAAQDDAEIDGEPEIDEVPPSAPAVQAAEPAVQEQDEPGAPSRRPRRR